MKLSDKTLQSLKTGKTQFKDLDEKYFYTTKSGIEVKNILDLLNNNICSFSQLVDRFKTFHELDRLFSNPKLFEKLTENGLLTAKDIQYWLNKTSNISILESLSLNLPLLEQLLSIETFSFQNLVDKYKNTLNNEDSSCLHYLLYSKELFESLTASNALDKDDLKYLLKNITKEYELEQFEKNSIAKHFVYEGIVSFQRLADNYKSIKDDNNEPVLCKLLRNTEFFNDLLKDNKLSKEDLKYLLNSITTSRELFTLCRMNKLLLQKILDERALDKTVLDAKTLERFETIIEKDDWYKDHNLCDVFDLLSWNTDFCILSKFDFNLDQKLELAEVLKDNKVAQSRTTQIVNNKLENDYDFETLMQYLKKPERKNLMNI